MKTRTIRRRRLPQWFTMREVILRKVFFRMKRTYVQRYLIWCRTWTKQGPKWLSLMLLLIIRKMRQFQCRSRKEIRLCLFKMETLLMGKCLRFRWSIPLKNMIRKTLLRVNFTRLELISALGTENSRYLTTMVITLWISKISTLQLCTEMRASRSWWDLPIRLLLTSRRWAKWITGIRVYFSLT